MSNKDVKTNLLSHSAAKVELLGEYLNRYLNIICNNKHTRRVKIHDLFCGEGEYENEGEGSPLVILRTVKDIHFVNVAKIKSIPKIDCSFNDINNEKILKLQQVIRKKSLYYSDFGGIEFTSCDYTEKLAVLSSELAIKDNTEHFIFIDPYEYKHIKASQIKDLMKNGNSEVLLWLPTQFMYRFSKNGTPLALKDFVEELVPYTQWTQSDSVWDYVSQLRTGMQRYLGNGYFVDTFTIQKDSATVFCLFFFSSHIKGFEKMLEAKWKLDDEQGKGWNYMGNQPSLFYDHKTNPLEELLTEYLKSGIRSNTDVYEFTLKQGFLPKHTNQVFTSLQTNGELEVQSLDSSKIRKGAFYVSYDYFKVRNNKVNYRLK